MTQSLDLIPPGNVRLIQEKFVHDFTISLLLLDLNTNTIKKNTKIIKIRNRDWLTD